MDASRNITRDGQLNLSGFCGLVIAVSDPVAAREFYCRILGFAAIGSDILPALGPHELISAGPNCLIALARAEAGRDFSASGVHRAYRTSAAGREAIRKRLKADGITIFGYREDREAEQNDRFYFLDLDGNRIQIVVDGRSQGDHVTGIDHVAVQVPDMMWGEEFYRRILMLPVESRFGLRTADHARARVWARGEDDMAPGTRRNDKLYMPMGGQNEIPRTNMQIYFRVGDGVLGVYLATKHEQEPPEDELWGAPRMLLAAPRSAIDKAAEALSAAGRAFHGPVEHPADAPLAASLYFKDTGGNFLEICALRGR